MSICSTLVCTNEAEGLNLRCQSCIAERQLERVEAIGMCETPECTNETRSDGGRFCPKCADAWVKASEIISEVPLPPNPKKIHGAGKPDLSLIPPVALHHMAMAFEDGGYKYGPFNWRDSSVEVRTYIAAGMRHFADYLDGSECASDSDVHNLGHTMACCAIILDAILNQLGI